MSDLYAHSLQGERGGVDRNIAVETDTGASPESPLRGGVDRNVGGIGQNASSMTRPGTESRMMTVFDLLRRLVERAQTDPGVRIAELQKRKAEIDREIREIQKGRLEVLDATQIRERFIQVAGTAELDRRWSRKVTDMRSWFVFSPFQGLVKAPAPRERGMPGVRSRSPWVMGAMAMSRGMLLVSAQGAALAKTRGAGEEPTRIRC